MTNQREIYTRCTACNIPIINADKSALLSHYRSFFHTTNLKRQSVNLQPVTLEDFHKIENYGIKADLGCRLCQKTLKNQKRLAQHEKDCIREIHSQQNSYHLDKDLNDLSLKETETKSDKNIDLGNTDRDFDIEEPITESSNEKVTDTSFQHIEAAIYDPSDLPFLHLPNGTVLGNKKFLVYFKQRHDRVFKPRCSQIIKLRNKNQEIMSKQKIRNDIKVAMQMNKPLRFRLQWSQ